MTSLIMQYGIGPSGLCELTLLGSKSSFTVKLSTTQEARLCSTQASTTINRANIWKSILDEGTNIIIRDIFTENQQLQ